MGINLARGRGPTVGTLDPSPEPGRLANLLGMEDDDLIRLARLAETAVWTTTLHRIRPSASVTDRAHLERENHLLIGRALQSALETAGMTVVSKRDLSPYRAPLKRA